VHVQETHAKTLPDREIWRDGPTNALANAFAGYHTPGFLLVGIRRRPSVCYPCG
jgi:hypothetical protein